MQTLQMNSVRIQPTSHRRPESYVSNTSSNMNDNSVFATTRRLNNSNDVSFQAQPANTSMLAQGPREEIKEEEEKLMDEICLEHDSNGNAR